MDSKRLIGTLQGAYLDGAGWQDDIQSFGLAMFLPRNCPWTRSYLGGDLLLMFQEVHTIAVGFDHAPPRWPLDDSVAGLSPPLHPQLVDIEVLETPRGNEVRALRGDLSCTSNAHYRFGFGLNLPPEYKPASRAWLQIWSDAVLVVGEQGPLDLDRLEREVETGWQCFYEANAQHLDTLPDRLRPCAERQRH